LILIAGLASIPGCRQILGFDDVSIVDLSGDAASDGTPVICPATYDVVLDGSTSRYRIITSPAVFRTHHATCNQDLPGATHLVALETAGEVNALGARLATDTATYYVGAVQAPNQAATDVAWSVFTGGPLPSGLWSSGQPDDSPNPGENNEDNLAAIDSTHLLLDAGGTLFYGAVCECDGKAIDPAVASLIPSFP